jgi:hypothetical protein
MSDLEGFDPRGKIFVAIFDNNENGSLDTSGEIPNWYDSLDEAVTDMRAVCRDSHTESFIYEMKLVRVVRRGAPRVEKVGK